MSVSQMISMVRGLVADQKGVTAVEYGVIAAAVAAALVAGMATFGPALTSLFVTTLTTSL